MLSFEDYKKHFTTERPKMSETRYIRELNPDKCISNWISFYVTTAKKKPGDFKVLFSFGKRIYESLNLRIFCWHKPDSNMLIIGGLLCFVSILPLLSQSLQVVVKEEKIVTKIGDNVQMICSAVSEKVGCSFTSPIGKFFFIVINFCSL